MKRMRVCALALAALVSAVLPASAADDTAASLREEYTAARTSHELDAAVGQDLVERALKVAKHAHENGLFVQRIRYQIDDIFGKELCQRPGDLDNRRFLDRLHGPDVKFSCRRGIHLKSPYLVATAVYSTPSS